MGASQSQSNNTINLKKHKYLSGPVSLYYLEKDDQKIFLFGDEHYSLRQTCKSDLDSIDFIKFLNTIFSTTEEKIDFLIESRYNYIENKDIKSVKNIYIDEMSYLTKVIKFYVKKGCLISNKKNCSKSYPNVNFHSVDYRFSNLCKPVEKIQNLIEELFILMFYLTTNNLKKILDLFKDTMESLKSYNTYSKMESLIESIFNCKKMKKQIEKCDNGIKSKILQYKNDVFKHNKKMHEESYNYITKELKEIFENSDEMFSFSMLNMHIAQLLNIIVSINTVVMDIYCLSRLFGSSMKNVVAYTGDAHTRNYVDFLTNYMDFDLKYGGKAVNRRCLNISKVPKILFSKK